MSALATALVRTGDEVTGADRNLATKNIAFLESIGVKCFPDDGSGVDRATDEVIVSTAIESDNAGLKKAAEFGIAVTHRAKALARTLSPFKLVAVVGTCGKSTVTAMLGHVLAECGKDPFCVNGANVPGWEGAVRTGRGEYAVAEVDESDKSLVAFKPFAAIVTNASADHYSEAEMNEVFDAFVKDCPGPVVDGRKISGEVATSIPGRHNRANAFLALEMAKALGCDEAKARAALLSFGGVERRLQRIYRFVDSSIYRIEHPQKVSMDSSPNLQIDESTNRRIDELPNRRIDESTNRRIPPAVYDDYAHNPEKLRAMWTTLVEAHPEGICVVWRPHGYAPLRKMLDALAKMFAETIRPVDKLLLLPVYDAGGTTDRSINSDALAAKLPAGSVELVADLDAAYEWISAHRGGYAAFATCGARDPGLPGLAAKIAGLF